MSVEQEIFDEEIRRLINGAESLADTCEDDKGTADLLREAARRIRDARTRYNEKRKWE